MRFPSPLQEQALKSRAELLSQLRGPTSLHSRMDRRLYGDSQNALGPQDLRIAAAVRVRALTEGPGRRMGPGE